MNEGGASPGVEISLPFATGSEENRSPVRGEGAEGGRLETSLLIARQLVEEAIVRHREEQARGLALIEHHTSEETLWPFFARFLRQAADRPSVVHVANFSWAQGARPLPAVSRLQDGMLGGSGRLKVLVDDESAGAPDIADRLADLEGRGALVRVCRSDLPSTLILGRAAAVLRMPGPLGRPGDRSLVLIRAPEVVAAMTAMVAALWGGALDLSIFRQRVALQTGLTGRVLFLLQTGHKDETAARMLGLSVRTYRRHVATLMERLNATSRFQAGTRASSLGIRSA